MSQSWAFVAGKQGTVFYHDMLCKGWGEEAGPGGERPVLCWRGLRPSSKDPRAAGGDLAVLSPREGGSWRPAQSSLTWVHGAGMKQGRFLHQGTERQVPLGEPGWALSWSMYGMYDTLGKTV